MRAVLVSMALAGVPAATILLAPNVVLAASADDQLNAASNEITKVEADIPTATTIKGKTSFLRSAEDMIADGELLFRLRDYPRAILVFSQVEEQYPNNKPVYAEAVYRVGEALYASKDYLSARTKFRKVADHSKEAEFRPYASRAIARLVDVAMRVDDPKDPKSADDVLQRIAQLPANEVDSTILYAKGKALYFKKDYEAAKTTLASVGADGGWQHQARFILGVIALKQSQPGKYNAAIDQFGKVAELPGDTDEHKEVIDLAWIAIGRLFYEMDQLDKAVLAYQHVGKDSKHYDTMLYELAWVHVRQEDMEKATRALDILGLVSPDGPYSIEGDLLKADILLRKAEFRKALEVYEKVRDQLDPMRKKLEDYLGSGKTPAEYYDKLTTTNFDVLEGPDTLPPIIIQWAKEQENGALAFSVVESVQQTKELLSQAQEMLDKLQMVVKGPNKVKAFPELRLTYERTVGLLNRIARARAQVGQGLDQVEPADVSAYPDLSATREQRRRLQAKILGLPVDDDGWAKQEGNAQAEWKALGQNLQQRQVEIDMLTTKVNALRRYLKTKTTDKGGAIPPAQLDEYKKKLDEEEVALAAMKKEAAAIKKQIDIGKVQVGPSDDSKLRDEYRDLLDKEIGLVQSQLGGDAKAYAAKAVPVLARARSAEDKALAQKNALDAEIDKRLIAVRAQLDAEQAALDSYREQLAKFDDEARQVVGEVAKRNFGLVKDKLTALVMRAEVGIIDQAWNDREVRKMILRDRQIELKEAEHLLDDELRQITQDGAGFE
ncbi:MAG: hypothetical protein ACXVEF_06890 [Polyangiales bacterium]